METVINLDGQCFECGTHRAELWIYWLGERACVVCRECNDQWSDCHEVNHLINLFDLEYNCP